MPDYNDPSDYIDPMFVEPSQSDSNQFNVTYVTDLADAALTEYNLTTRANDYYLIQKYIVETDFSWIILGVPGDWGCWAVGVTGFPQNGMGYADFYTVSYTAPGSYLHSWI